MGSAGGEALPGRGRPARRLAHHGPSARAGDQGRRPPLVGAVARGPRFPRPQPGALPVVPRRRAGRRAAAGRGRSGRRHPPGCDHRKRRGTGGAHRFRTRQPGRAQHRAGRRLLRRDRHRRGSGGPGRGRVRRIRRAADRAGRADRNRWPGRTELTDRELSRLPRRSLRGAAHRPCPPTGNQIRRRGTHRP